jgi:hypothetical protein
MRSGVVIDERIGWVSDNGVYFLKSTDANSHFYYSNKERGSFRG